MTKDELGITDAGERFIDAILARGRQERSFRTGRKQFENPYAEHRVKIARAHVRVEGGVADAEDLALVAEFPEG